MNILTCLCYRVPYHVEIGIGYISLFAFMDAESDVPRAKRAHAAHGTSLINFGSDKRSYIF